MKTTCKSLLRVYLNLCSLYRFSSGSSSASREGFYPCIDFNRRISVHGETYLINDCTSCTCDNSTLYCTLLSCPPPGCRSPHRREGVCCRECPYSKFIFKLLLGERFSSCRGSLHVRRKHKKLVAQLKRRRI